MEKVLQACATVMLGYLDSYSQVSLICTNQEIRSALVSRDPYVKRALLKRVLADDENEKVALKRSKVRIVDYKPFQIEIELTKDTEEDEGDLLELPHRGLVRVRNKFKCEWSTYVSPGKTPSEFKYFIEDNKVYAGKKPGFKCDLYDSFADIPLKQFPEVLWIQIGDLSAPVSYTLPSGGDLTLDDLFEMEHEALWPNFSNDRYGVAGNSAGRAMNRLLRFMRENLHRVVEHLPIAMGNKLNPAFVRIWSELMSDAVDSDELIQGWFGAPKGPRLFNSLREAMGIEELPDETMIVKFV
jgi:hypothetical protein